MALPSFNDDKETKNKENKKEKKAFSMPELDDFEFESVPVDKVSDIDDRDINKEMYEGIGESEASLPKMEPNDIESSTKGYQVEDDYNPEFEENFKEQENTEGTSYINEDKKKIVPLGGEKSVRRVKSSDFDDRNNSLAVTKILRTIVLLILAALFLFGIKNTFFPSHVYSDEQIKAFARQGAGQTNFPKERGRAYVESFMEVYLSFDRDKPETKEILTHYYGEDSYATLSGDTLRKYESQNTKQHIIVSPQVHEITMLTDYSAQYKVNAYVSDTDGTEVSEGRSTGRWLSFAINLYYDKNVDGLVITKDSPSIIPTYRTIKQSNIPTEAVLGNGQVNEEILPALTPTINGFVKAYANASIASHEEILQYISDKNSVDLYDGFGGSVKLDGEPSQAIRKTVYNSDDGEYRVNLEIKWIDNAASKGDNSVEYNSRYIMRIKGIGDGRYVVTSFKPFFFFAE